MYYELLEVIAEAVDDPATHAALLTTCTRLRGAALAAPVALLVRAPSQAGWRARRRSHFAAAVAAAARGGTGQALVRSDVGGGGFPTETAAAAAHLLASVERFLSSHQQVQSLTLRRNFGLAAPPGAPGIDIRFFRKLLPLLARLPLITLCVPNMALTMCRTPAAPTPLSLSAVPLRRLTVTNLLRGASGESLRWALAAHAASLEALTLGDEDVWADREPDGALRSWLPPAGAPLPRLTALTLINLNVDAAAAAAVAAACPTLTHLNVKGDWMAGAGASLRYPAALPALTHVAWTTCESILAALPQASTQAAELAALLGGRTLHTLSLSGSLLGDAQTLVCRVVAACPQLAASLDVSSFVLDEEGVTALCGAAGAGRVSTLALRLASGTVADSVCRLGAHLPVLNSLSIRCDQAEWPLAHPPLSSRGWPLGRLDRLALAMDVGADGPDAAAPLALLSTLAACAAARRTLRVLALSGPPLTEAAAAAAVGALTALRRVEYTVVAPAADGDDDEARRVVTMITATAGLRRWLLDTLPAGGEVSMLVSRV
ncbi:hypothetical protein I4F81_005411 [Pyropia yezoensis]|uniref:Uncharacterized protein n=1 Tax=Pyropia yezoensis TaxID=2788 RepID=A0ACC3BY48_PYRYE|nr:hypothetical protein I4F81_005411 [Neopyropia yezoensis]